MVNKLIRQAELLSYIPDYLREYDEMKAVQQVLQTEIQRLEDETEAVFYNQFIKECDLRGIKRYEDMLKLQCLDDTELANRKLKLLSRWNRKIPYTRVVLKEELALLCGKDGYTLDIRPDKTIIVKVALKNKSSFAEVAKMLEEFVPCNMVINLSLLYNQHGTIRQLTHRQLRAWKHGQIRNEVLIK